MLLRALLVLLASLNLGVALWWSFAGSAPARAEGDDPGPTAGLAPLELHRAAVAPSPAATSPRPAAATAMALPSTSAPRCFRFGPFESAEDAFTARVALAPDVDRLVAREQPAARGRGWRVVVPPQASPDAAEALAERIRAAGFADLFVMREGLDANAIALGRFGGEASARRHADALRAAGFAAVAEPIGGRTAQTWLDVAAAPGFDAARALGATGAAQQRAIDCASLG